MTPQFLLSEEGLFLECRSMIGLRGLPKQKVKIMLNMGAHEELSGKMVVRIELDGIKYRCCIKTGQLFDAAGRCLSSDRIRIWEKPK